MNWFVRNEGETKVTLSTKNITKSPKHGQAKIN